MINGQRGWAVDRQGNVYTTDSGGAAWTRISQLNDFTGAYQIQFLNEKEGWILEVLSIWSTRDGGVTWHEKFSVTNPGMAGQPLSMFLVNANTVISSGSEGQVYLTRDGGETWNMQGPFADKSTLNDIWFVDDKRGWLTGYHILVAGRRSSRPLLFQTTDGGTSWQQIAVEADILPSSVCFVGDDGWLAGSRRVVNGNSITLQGALLHTTDDGINWEPVELGPNEPFLTEVRFTDKEHGWVVSRDTLYRTEDGGKTWKPVLSLPPPA